jgi:hypothetical protein
LRFYGFDSLCILGLSILDVLCLVEHDRIECEFSISFCVTANERVAGDDDVAAGYLVKQTVTFGPCNGQHSKGGSEFPGFRYPIKYQAGGTND